jgi:hypothetical protein
MIDIIPIISGLVSKAPWLVTILTLVGTLRVINKPLFALLRAFASSTPSMKDDEFINAAEQSKMYKSFIFFIDWFGSIKVNK